MKVIDACLIGEDCGLTTIEEAIRNIQIHAVSLFTFDDLEAELIELEEDSKNYSEDALIVDIIKQDDEELEFPYYDKPTMVQFITSGNEEELSINYGIAYCDEIICGCCGGIISFEDVITWRDLTWIDISDEIRGT